MSRPKILNNLEKLNDSALSTMAQHIINSLTGNSYFPALTPSLDEVTTVKKEFDDSLIAAQTGDRVKIAIKNEKRTNLIDILHRLARCVEMVANGNRSILLSSGFEVSKERSSTTELEIPENLKIMDGNASGEIYVCCDSVQGARSYVFEYTLDPLANESSWTSQTTTKSEFIIKGLIPGKKYWVRVIAIGSNDQRTVSAPVSRYA
ncbi:fibronectin type III domain-containing protein [Parabacteroides sp. FAFU027]|uniref:fibronectin type III domain-containing protein n=1 Tax=Parabacteroides sp. FAFU027 TaxID=2922715 RepID=UPI001FB01346|nr:fibronectin type III domain-containing protein [Parabacteroides sp. FAFU027]